MRHVPHYWSLDTIVDQIKVRKQRRTFILIGLAITFIAIPSTFLVGELFFRLLAIVGLFWGIQGFLNGRALRMLRDRRRELLEE